MTNAPKTVGLVHNGFGGWRLWTADDADDPTVESALYILAAEHERLMAERDAEIARLREALTPFGDVADMIASEMEGVDARDEWGLWLHEDDTPKWHAMSFHTSTFNAARAALGDDNG